MISRAILNDRLALERRSITELATGLSAIAVVGATLYNIGFFAPIEWSLISLLTVQDLLTGAAVAAVPMAMATWVALLIGRLIGLAPTRVGMTIIAGLPTLVISGAGFLYFLICAGPSIFGHFACGYFALGVIAAGVNIIYESRRATALWLVFSLLYIPAGLGMADSAAASGSQRPLSQIETDQGAYLGRVVRVTSNYILIRRDNAIITLPMSKVRALRRYYIQSPEADFLSGSLPASAPVWR